MTARPAHWRRLANCTCIARQPPWRRRDDQGQRGRINAVEMSGRFGLPGRDHVFAEGVLARAIPCG